MSRHKEPARLWQSPNPRPGRRNPFIILDGGKQYSTGCYDGDRAGAERAFARHLQDKHSDAIVVGVKDPTQIPISDAINLYLKNVVPHRARQGEIVDRLLRVSAFFLDNHLSYITGATCRAYVESRSTPAAARRELEDLRAAINHHRSEGLHDKIVSVVLPTKAVPRERWLTRVEAAALIRAAWRYREKQGGPMAGRHTRKHVARFMTVARYMGARAAVICGASIEAKRPQDRPWVDLSRGVFYGRPAGERETKKRRQTVRVPPALLAHMRRWRARGQKYVVQWNGKPVTNVAKAHRSVVADAGLGPDVTPHVWRHSVATWLVEKGIKPAEVARFLAMSEHTLMRVYRHHQPSDFADLHKAL